MREEALQLTDPRALRAVARPGRRRPRGELRRSGTPAAALAGERIDARPTSCSLHLRRLARRGPVEEAADGHVRGDEAVEVD